MNKVYIPPEVITVPGPGFKPALVRQDVDLIISSLFMDLAFHQCILTGQIRAMGFKGYKMLIFGVLCSK
jgi:hypothetical protein